MTPGKPSPGQIALIQGVFVNNKHQYQIRYRNSPEFGLTVPLIGNKPGGIVSFEPVNAASEAQNFTLLASITAGRVHIFSGFSQSSLAAGPQATLITSPNENTTYEDWTLQSQSTAAISLANSGRSPYGGPRLWLKGSGLGGNTQYNFHFMGVPFQASDNAIIYHQGGARGTTIQPVSDAQGNLSAVLDTPILPGDPSITDHQGHTIVALEDTSSNLIAYTAMPNAVLFLA